MDKITFENYPSQNSVLTAEKMNLLQTNVENAINPIAVISTPEAIFCNIPSDLNMTTSYSNITSWQQLLKVGSNLSISGGRVRIGSNINHVKVTAKISVNSNKSGGTLFYSFIKKNDSNVTGAWATNWISEGSTEVVYNQAIIEVSSNDRITINYYGEGTVLNLTSLIVEKID